MAEIGRPRFFQTPKDLRDAVEVYFLELEQKNQELLDSGNPQLMKKPTLTKMILSIGLSSRESFKLYANYGDDFKEVHDWAKLKIESSYEEAMASGHVQVAGAIFALKNFGWSDKQEIEHSGGVKSSIRYTANMPERGQSED